MFGEWDVYVVPRSLAGIGASNLVCAAVYVHLAACDTLLMQQLHSRRN